MKQKGPGFFRKQNILTSMFSTKTNPGKKKKPRPKTSFAGMERLVNAYPAIRTGKSFISYAMAKFRSSPELSAMIMALKEPLQADQGIVSQKGVDLLMEAASVLDPITNINNGVWGLLDYYIFGCFFPDKNKNGAKKIAKKIRNHPKIQNLESVYIGIAGYPSFSFLRGQIIDNAKKAYEHAVLLGPGSIVYLNSMSLNISADKLYDKKKLKWAIEEYKMALMMDQKNVTARNSLGVCFGNLGKFKEALKEFRESISIDPRDPGPLYNAGFASLCMGETDNALNFFLRAERIDPNIYAPGFHAGRIYFKIGQPKKGKDFLEKVVKIKPESAAAHFFLGECCSALKLFDEAESAYKKAIKLKPNYAAALSSLGYFYLNKKKNRDISIMLCKKSVALDPSNGLFHHRLGELYQFYNKNNEAAIEFEKAKNLRFVKKEQNHEVEKPIENV